METKRFEYDFCRPFPQDEEQRHLLCDRDRGHANQSAHWQRNTGHRIQIHPWLWFGEWFSKYHIWPYPSGLSINFAFICILSAARTIGGCRRQQYISWQAIGQIVSACCVNRALISLSHSFSYWVHSCVFPFARIVATVTLLAEHLGCYKMSLECKDSLVKFYTSIGYVLEPGNGNSMHLRYGQTVAKQNGSTSTQPSWQLATGANVPSKSKL